MTINIKVVSTTEGMPQLRKVPWRSAAAVVIEGWPRARGHIDYATSSFLAIIFGKVSNDILSAYLKS